MAVLSGDSEFWHALEQNVLLCFDLKAGDGSAAGVFLWPAVVLHVWLFFDLQARAGSAVGILLKRDVGLHLLL